MRISKRVIIIQMGIMLVFGTVLVMGENSGNDDNIIETLKYIADGYNSNKNNITRLQLSGRIYHAQYAEEGKTIADSKVFSPKWLSFVYIEKDGKKRYEQDRIDNSKLRSFVLDNNKRILSYESNVVKLFPLDGEEDSWSKRCKTYGEFSKLSPKKGYSSVGEAMETIIEDIKSGKYEQEDWNISLNLDEKGVFTCTLNRKSYSEEYQIDSNKGFNLIKTKFLYSSTRRPHEKESSYEYKQTDGGQWVLSTAKIKGVEVGVVYERRLETTELKTEFEVSDNIFEEESLNIPLGIYRIDFAFSPPLEINEGSTPDFDFLEGIEDVESLLESEIELAEIAEIKKTGVIKINKHLAYVEHEEKKIAINESQDGSGRVFTKNHIIVLIIGVFVTIIAVFIFMKRRA